MGAYLDEVTAALGARGRMGEKGGRNKEDGGRREDGPDVTGSGSVLCGAVALRARFARVECLLEFSSVQASAVA